MSQLFRGCLGVFPDTLYRPQRHCEAGTFGALVVMTIFMPVLFLAYRNISLPCSNLCPNCFGMSRRVPRDLPPAPTALWVRNIWHFGCNYNIHTRTVFKHVGIFLYHVPIYVPTASGWLGVFPDTLYRPWRHCKSGTFGTLVVMTIFMPGLFLAYSNISLPCSYLCPNCFAMSRSVPRHPLRAPTALQVRNIWHFGWGLLPALTAFWVRNIQRFGCTDNIHTRIVFSI